MRPEFHDLDVKYDDTAGAASEGSPTELPSICVDHTIQVTGTLTATDLRVEVSNDGSTWVELDAFTAVGLEVYEGHAFRLIRVRTEAFAPGDTPAVIYGGMNVRAEA